MMKIEIELDDDMWKDFRASLKQITAEDMNDKEAAHFLRNVCLEYIVNSVEERD